MGAFSLCHETSSGAAFIVGAGTARGRSIWVDLEDGRSIEVSAAQEPFAELMGCPGQEMRCLGVRAESGKRLATVHERLGQRVLLVDGDKATGQTSK